MLGENQHPKGPGLLGTDHTQASHPVQSLYWPSPQRPWKNSAREPLLQLEAWRGLAGQSWPHLHGGPASISPSPFPPPRASRSSSGHPSPVPTEPATAHLLGRADHPAGLILDAGAIRWRWLHQGGDLSALEAEGQGPAQVKLRNRLV